MAAPRLCKLCLVELTTENTYKTGGLRCRTCRLAEEKKRPRTPNMVGQLLASAKSRAKRDSVPFAISHADIVIPAICPVLGIPLSHGKGVGSVHDGSPSLDKIIPELGYVPGNIHVISHRANRIKADATRSELQAVLAYVEKYSK